MEQRPLRLGDILDDYCPRERRVTNHAVVAMFEDQVKQTRCTTCDAEHAYKGARVPARRSRKETPAALYKEVLAGLPEVEGAKAPLLAIAAPALAAPIPVDVVPPLDTLPTPVVVAAPDRPVRRGHLASRPSTMGEGHAAPSPIAVAADVVQKAPPEGPSDQADDVAFVGDDDAPVEGPVHRRLIRATLPRIEGQKEARPLPEFTVRQAPSRGNGHGNGHGHGGGHSHGNGGGFRNERMRMRSGSGGSAQGHGFGNRSHGNGGQRFHGGQGNRTSGPPRQGGPSGFRSGNGNGNGNGGGKRGRGSRG